MLVSMVMAALGVPLWMLLGMLILIIWNSKRVKGQPGTFPVKVKLETGSDEDSKWDRTQRNRSDADGSVWDQRR